MLESAYQNRSVPEGNASTAKDASALHPDLRAAFESLEKRFRQDARCRGLYLRGSAMSDTADTYSDVDACVVVSSADYATFKQDLRGICNACCGETLGWLCKSEREHYTDYTFLFGATTDDALLAFDLSVNTPTALTIFPVTPEQFVFCRIPHDITAVSKAPSPPSPYTAEEVRRTVTEYWSVLYLHGKYLRRGDALRSLYIQQRLLELHVRILNAATAPTTRWVWWAKEAAGLSPEQRNTLLAYGTGAETTSAVAASLPGHMDRFAADARAACKRCSVGYPDEMEQRVRRSVTQAISAASQRCSAAGELTEE